MTTVPFDALIFNSSLTIRATDEGDEAVDTLASSIKAHGVLVPLTVRAAGNHVEIVKGGRRWRAIKRLVAGGDLPGDISIPVHYIDAEDDTDARERALAASIERTPLHPIDQFEAFSSLRDRYTPAEIASRFGVSERFVKQRMALGHLHPEIRDAWRNEDIEDDAAQAFTLTHDQDRQVRLFRDLSQKGYVYARAVRAALGTSHDAQRAIQVIGVDAYTAAGGHVTEDLFNPGVYAISDPDLAIKMLDDAIDEECRRLVADGWQFALPSAGVKDHWKWQKQPSGGKLTPEEVLELAKLHEDKKVLDDAAYENEDGLTEEQESRFEEIDARIAQIKESADMRGWTPALKKKLGCFVEIYGEELTVTYGVKRPVEPKAEKNKSVVAAKPSDDAGGDGDVDEDADTPAPGPSISATLQAALNEQQTVAAALTLKDRPWIALRAALAAIDGNSYGVVRISKNGHNAVRDIGEIPDDGDEEDFVFGFSDNFEKARELDEQEVVNRLAVMIARSLNLSSDSEGAISLIGAMNREEYEKNARQAFDAEGYFKSVTVDLCNAALDEMCAAMASGSRPKKKADLVKMCVENATHAGWLPVQLRYPGK